MPNSPQPVSRPGGTQTPYWSVLRLTQYLALVKEVRERDAKWLTSKDIADALELTSATVRKDLTHVDILGKTHWGYDTEELEHALTTALGADQQWRVVVLGAGNLGRALTQHEEFRRQGYNVVAVFDSDSGKVGSKIGKTPVMGLDVLDDVIKKEQVQIGIIAVPPNAAQEAADILTRCGIRGLLNLTTAHIVTPPGISVVHSRIMSSLQQLSHDLRLMRPST